MRKHIALFRGINVSGQKLIKMAELRQNFLDWGFQHVQSYIQSGNVVFSSDIKDTHKLAQILMKRIRESYDFDVNIQVTGPDYLKSVLANNPFDKDYLKLTYFTLLDEIPDSDKVKQIDAAKFLPDRFDVIDNVVYIYCPNGAGKSKLSNNLFEKKLGLNATTRNYNTINKLIELASS